MMLLEIKNEVRDIRQKAIKSSIDEVSMSKVCRMLHLGPESVKREIRLNRLKARDYTDGQNKKRYRFKLSDVIEYQESRLSNHNEQVSISVPRIETAEEIGRRIFGNSHK